MTHDDAGPSVASAGSHAEVRERFAAAALTGLLSKTLCPEEAMSACVRIAAVYADAMLRELERTSHGALPEARANTDADRDRTDKAAPRPGEGTGNQTAPPCVETDGPPSQGEGLHFPDSRTQLLDDAMYWLGQNHSEALRTHSDGCRRWHSTCLVAALVAEVRRLRLVICDQISELGEEMERTPEPPSTPGEGSVRTGRTCHRCGGDGIQLTEVNTYGEATCGTCRGSGRLD